MPEIPMLANYSSNMAHFGPNSPSIGASNGVERAKNQSQLYRTMDVTAFDNFKAEGEKQK